MSSSVKWMGLSLANLALLLTLAGCGREAAPPAGGPAVETKSPDGKEPTTVVKKDERARMGQPFKDAVLLEPPVMDDVELLVDVTCTGKNVAKLFEAIAGSDKQPGLWDQVKLVDEQGQPLKYRAILTTKLGAIEIELYPAAAPNHVRNFVALARAGYFDGMPIFRSVNDKVGDTLYAYLESGCPKGTGDAGYGSIGYWLKPEIEGNPLTQDAGAVSAYHREEPETAACRFYIAAEKMPQMDGAYTVFGKVTRGLDLVRTMNRALVEDKIAWRLKEPVPIEKVVIESP